MQLFGLALTFVVVLVLVGRRVALGWCLAVGTVLLALTSRMPWTALAGSVWSGLSQSETIELVLDVAGITSLAGVLKAFGLLDEMVESLTALAGGARLAIMAVPSLIGTLPVLGGAILSAPMVDGLGDRLGLSTPRKAAVNLVFRHAWFYVAPFSPSLVLAAELAHVPLGRLIFLQSPFALLMLVTGFAALLRQRDTGRLETAASDPAPAARARLTPKAAVGPFLRSISPLILSVVLSVGAAPVCLPLYAAVGAGLALALLLSRRHPAFRWAGLPVAWASIQWEIVVTMASVMVFGRVMQDSGTSGALVDWLVGSGLPVWVLMLVLPLAMGYVSGAPAVPIGVSFPVLLPLAAPDRSLVTAAVLFVVGFQAYFVSPLHLCQVLSSQFFGVSVPRLYREYWPVTAVLALLTAVYVWLAFA